MIVADLESGLRVITQHDHAALAADLLALWRRNGVVENRWRDEILRATREHDNGWQESDAAPVLNADGGLHDYRSAPEELRREIWLRGCRRLADERPLETALILAHCLYLHRDQRTNAAWSGFFAQLTDLRDAIEEANPDATAIGDFYPHLRRVDWLALALCEDAREVDLGDGSRLERLGDDASDAARYRLTPFPFAGTTRFRVSARYLERRSWPSSVDLVGDLARARWTRAEFVLQA